MDLPQDSISVTLKKPPVDKTGNPVFFLDGKPTLNWKQVPILPEDIKKTEKAFIRLVLPAVRYNDPVLYLQADLEKFRIFQGNTLIYDYPQPSSDELPDFGFHIIPVDTASGNRVLFIELQFSSVFDLGNVTAAKIGSRNDLLGLAFKTQAESLQTGIMTLILGLILFSSGLIILVMFFWKPVNFKSPFLPFSVLVLLSGFDYLIKANESFLPFHPFEIPNGLLAPGLLLLIAIIPLLLLLFFERKYGSGWKQIVRWLKYAHILLLVVMVVSLFQLEWLNTLEMGAIFFILIEGIALITTLIFLKNKGRFYWMTLSGFIFIYLLAVFDSIGSLTSPGYEFSQYGFGVLLLVIVYGWQEFSRYHQTHKIVERVTLELDLKQTELLALQKEQVQTQLQALKAQISPHFLFNSFSTLLGLIEETPDKASRFVQELSNVYRYLLLSGNKDLTTLSAELDFVQAYRFLLEHRHGDGLIFRFEEEAGSESLMLPVLTLQLLIENATKHNSTSSKKPLEITIRVSGKRLIVSNTLQKKSTFGKSTGIGLANIRERYRFYTSEEVQISETDSEFIVSVPLLEP
ncbi:MAG: histidine kinase [Bacteroidetes bacterium]|nr:histidine kinase [Bacteroidota bacterium]